MTVVIAQAQVVNVNATTVGKYGDHTVGGGLSNV